MIMRKLLFIASLGVASLGLTACGDRDVESNASANTSGTPASAAESGDTASGGSTAAGTAFPKGARIVEDNGVTFRVDPDGTRVRLAPTESRIVVEEGVRFRVDPDGSRVRISEEGLEVDLDDDVRVRVGDNPAVEINTSR